MRKPVKPPGRRDESVEYPLEIYTEDVAMAIRNSGDFNDEDGCWPPNFPLCLKKLRAGLGLSQ